MNDTRTAKGTAERVGSAGGRVIRAWRSLPPERRLAAFASIGLFLTLFLPWYQETVLVANGTKLPVATASLSGWAAFSFVEAAVLLVAAGVLLLLFQRAEGKAFHVPGGDGGVITAAGVWTCVLIVWRIFDKQSTSIHGPGASISGIEWGIFVALVVAAVLTYAGTRIRSAHRPEPPLPGEDPTPQRNPSPSPSRTASRRAQTPRPVAADRAPKQVAAEEQRPTRRRRSTAGLADRPVAGESRTGAADWKEPQTDWIDGEGRRTRRSAREDSGTRRQAGGDALAPRDAGEDRRSPQDAGEGRRSPQDAGEGRRSPQDAGEGRRSPQDAGGDRGTARDDGEHRPTRRGAEDQTEPLRPSTHAARRTQPQPPDDQMTIPRERQD